MLRLLSEVKHSPKIESIRQYTNLLYYDPEAVNLKIKDVDYISVDGYKFKMTDQVNSVRRVIGNPWFSNARASDTVLDIGANIGAITIPLAQVARQVYAVEPIFSHELMDNVELNGLKNISCLKYAVGIPRDDTEEVEIQFAGRRERVPVIQFKHLRETLEMDGQRLNFLKMDGEGCEWTFEPSELEGIRELRIEFHIKRGRRRECYLKLDEYLKWVRKAGYKMVLEHPNYGPDPYDAEDYMLRASLESIS